MDDTDIFPEGIQPLLGFDGVDRQSGSLFVTSCWWKNCGSPYRCSVHCCRQVCWLYSIGSFCAPSFRAFFISRRLRRLGFHPRQIHLRPGTGPVAGSNTLPWRMKLSASWSALPTWNGTRVPNDLSWQDWHDVLPGGTLVGCGAAGCTSSTVGCASHQVSLPPIAFSPSSEDRFKNNLS